MRICTGQPPASVFCQCFSFVSRALNKPQSTTPPDKHSCSVAVAACSASLRLAQAGCCSALSFCCDAAVLFVCLIMPGCSQVLGHCLLHRALGHCTNDCLNLLAICTAQQSTGRHSAAQCSRAGICSGMRVSTTRGRNVNKLRSQRYSLLAPNPLQRAEQDNNLHACFCALVSHGRHVQVCHGPSKAAAAARHPQQLDQAVEAKLLVVATVQNLAAKTNQSGCCQVAYP
jgi:hypothetical protein